MGEWREGRMERRMDDGWMAGRMMWRRKNGRRETVDDRWRERRKVRWMGGWREGKMERRMDGQNDDVEKEEWA